jgi:hypothetical protein
LNDPAGKINKTETAHGKRPPTLQAEEKEAKTVEEFPGAVAEW